MDTPYEQKPPPRVRDHLPALLILGSPVVVALMTGGALTGDRYFKAYVGAWVGRTILSANGAIAVAGSAIGGMLVRGRLDSKIAVTVACATFGSAAYHFCVAALRWVLWRF